MDMIKENLKKELDRRIKKGVRNIKISPLFEVGKTYNMKTDKEDPNGTLTPNVNHCWLTWQSKWIDYDDSVKWSNEAYNFKTIQDAEVGKKYLEKSLV